MAERPGTCTSCGADVGELVAVRRKYVTGAGLDPAWQTDAPAPNERVVDEIEHWCFPCLTHYPHELADV